MKLILVLVICLCLCVIGREERCSLLPDRGICRGYILRQHFNPTSRRCEEFVYGGCRGNGNNFKTLEECQEVCEALTEVISQSPEAGESLNTPPIDDSSADAVKSPPASNPEKPSVFSIEPLDGSKPGKGEALDGSKPGKEEALDGRKPGKEEPLDGSKPGKEEPLDGRKPGKEEPLDGRKPGKEDNLVMGDHVGDIPREPSKEENPRGNFTGGLSQVGQSQGNFHDGQSQSTHNDDTAGEIPAADVLTDGKGPTAPDSAQPQPPPSEESALPDCSSPLDQGPCRGLFQRFNYKRDQDTCEEFTYGGCAGNFNRYNTKEECETSCLQAPAKPKEPAKNTSSVLTTDEHVSVK